MKGEERERGRRVCGREERERGEVRKREGGEKERGEIGRNGINRKKKEKILSVHPNIHI